MISVFRTGLFALALIHAPVPLQAHHSFIGNYDGTKVMSLKGVITGVRYVNPHIFITLSVTRKNGASETWKVEAEGIAKARAKGMTKERLKSGTSVTVRGWPARNGSRSLGMQSIILPGGKAVKMRSTVR